MHLLLRSILAGLPVLFLSSTSFADSLAAGDPAAQLQLTRVVNGLEGPTAAEFLPDGRMVIIEQRGLVKVRLTNGTIVEAGQLSVLNRGERGLLGLAVDPQFATSRRLYFYYSRPGSTDVDNDRNRVAYRTLDPATHQLGAETVIVTGIFGPANHNGGGITFGPDGHLYIGVGDTGCNCGCAPGLADNYFGTCLSNKNGKILRVDREGGIPASNPLANETQVTGCGNGHVCSAANQEADPSVLRPPAREIYNWGFRNPWRFSFDPIPPHHLWIGDVGEITWEEITVSTGPGQHHGWPYREGAAGDPRSTCNTITGRGACKDPAFAYPHPTGSSQRGASVTGGVFSAHCSWPAPWAGRYWFADYNINRVWTLTPNAARDGVQGGQTTVVENTAGPVHFFNGPDGGVYYVNINVGNIFRITPSNPVSCAGPDAGTPDVGPSDVASADTSNADGATADASPDAGPEDVGGEDQGIVGEDAQAGADVQPSDNGSVPVDAGVDAGGGDADPSADVDVADAADPSNPVLMAEARGTNRSGAELGEADVPVLAVRLRTADEMLTLNRLTVSAVGRLVGNVVASFSLWEDVNGDGVLQANEPKLASVPSWSSGPLVLSPSELSVASGTSKDLVLTATFEQPTATQALLVPIGGYEVFGSVAMGGLLLILASLLFRPKMTWAATASMLALALLLGSCSSSSNSSGDEETLDIRFSLSSIESVGAVSKQPANVEGLPVSGPELSISVKR